MKALRLNSWKSNAVLEDVPVPEPGPGEVLVQVGAAGACHSDLHLMHDFEADTLPWSPPFTLGHENAGWVHTLGEGVRGLEPGQPVAVVGAWGCGTCARCLDGLETYCEQPDLAPVPGGGGGLGLDGGMAEYLLVPAAPTWTRTSPGPGSGTGTSSSTALLFQEFRRSAFMLFLSDGVRTARRLRPGSSRPSLPPRGGPDSGASDRWAGGRWSLGRADPWREG